MKEHHWKKISLACYSKLLSKLRPENLDKNLIQHGGRQTILFIELCLSVAVSFQTAGQSGEHRLWATLDYQVCAQVSLMHPALASSFCEFLILTYLFNSFFKFF